ncbi:MAG: SGNH/GDSL hydrolase family protein [Planctomycetes bacterium]|nr:SGNH/GDSL hydrolase family protein [Planctomycetota bacterium]
MKSILCYGDSNTWGYIPGSGQRYPRDVRWPGVLQNHLGGEFHVVEEGLNARTTVSDDPIRGGAIKNGLTYLKPCLDSHAPLDLVILMLGTNDLKHRFGFSAYDIACNVATLIGVIQPTPVLLLAPPHVGPLTALADLFAGAPEKSRQLAAHCQAFAQQMGCRFFDVANVVQSSPIDGVHWAPEQHAALGKRMAALVQEILVN